MTRVGEKRPTQTAAPIDPMVQRGFRKDKEVEVPLDFLQSVASIAHRNLERRPPKLRFDRRKSQEEGQVDLPELHLAPQLSKESEEVAFEIAEMLLRLKPEIEASDDIGARRGYDTLDRMCRMFVQVYESRTRP